MHKKTLARFVSLLLALTVTGSIAEAQNNSGKSARTKSISKQPAARGPNSKAAVSEQDCLAYAQSLTKAFSAGDLAAFNALIDWDALFGTVLDGLAVTGNQRREFMTELKGTIDKEAALTGQLIKNGKAGGKLDYLRSRQNRGRQVVLMRMLQPNGTGGVGYFEFVPQNSADGKIRAVDIYVYLNSEFFTETLRHALLPIVASQSRTLLDKLLTTERDYVRDLPKLQAITELTNQGKYREALAQYKALGPDTKKEKAILMLRLRAAQAFDEKEYTDVLEDFRRLYPNDPCVDLLSIDYYTLKKNLPAALASVDRLDKAVGGDPYLNILRAGISEAGGDLESAMKFGNRAIEEDPSMLNAYFYVIATSMKASKYDVTLATLKKQDQAFKMTYNDLKTVPAYAGFVKSPQYPEWLKYLAQKGSGQKASPAKTKKARPSRLKTGSGN